MDVIRLARSDDLESINDIYNYYVIHSTCTYQTEAETMDGRRTWFASYGPQHPITVYESENKILGWGSLTPFRSRAAYANTVENSVYLRHDVCGKGIGSLLLKDLIERGRAAGHHVIVAGIDAEQTHSVKLHLKFGFEHVAHFKEIGFKFNRWLDVIFMQKTL